MAETIVQVNSGSGPKLHGWDRTVGANTVIDDFSLPGEYPYPTYTAASIGVSVATNGDHILQVMAGASLNVRIRRIRIEQSVLVTAAAFLTLQLFRLTTAGTGGTALTPQKMDNGDVAAGATAMTIPTVKGTEAATMTDLRVLTLVQTAPVGGLSQPPFAEWVWSPNEKGIIIAAGAANGLAVKVNTGRAGASVNVSVDFVETAYL